MSALVEEAFGFGKVGMRLEGALHRGDRPLALVALHPHPQYGGDMHNHVVAAVCAAFAGEGATTLRFNFRGVGGSAGAFDGGRGEVDDALSAVATVRQLSPRAAVVLAGYSFGAMVAASAALRLDLAGVMLISLPLADASPPALPANVEALMISGEGDGLSPAAALAGLTGARCRVVLVPGAGHSWWPRIDALTSEVAAFAASIGARADTQHSR